MTSTFVTGAAGYIGSSFAWQALAANYQDYGLTRSFESDYPDIDTGIPAVVRRWRASLV